MWLHRIIYSIAKNVGGCYIWTETAFLKNWRIKIWWYTIVQCNSKYINYSYLMNLILALLSQTTNFNNYYMLTFLAIWYTRERGGGAKVLKLPPLILLFYKNAFLHMKMSWYFNSLCADNAYCTLVQPLKLYTTDHTVHKINTLSSLFCEWVHVVNPKSTFQSTRETSYRNSICTDILYWIIDYKYILYPYYRRHLHVNVYYLDLDWI